MSTETIASSLPDALSGNPQVGFMPTSKRVLFAALGLLFVGIGLVGVFLPGIPTTGPVIAASFFLTRSSPRLERRLLRIRLFRSAMPYLYGAAPMPLRARLWALAWMWGSILASCTCLAISARAGGILITATLGMGLAGTFVILRFRRGPADPAVQNRLPVTRERHTQHARQPAMSHRSSAPAEFRPVAASSPSAAMRGKRSEQLILQ